MQEVIYTFYKEQPEKRGTLVGDTFNRDNTPLVRGHLIALEPDVVRQLDNKGCRYLQFSIRKPKCLCRCRIEDFKNAEMKLIGIPDKRLQKVVYYKPFILRDKVLAVR